jgi:histidinol dehydrogenase
LAGATEIYKIGGAQAIGALSFGTATIRPVCKIFGPGNAYVTEAKRQVFGYVAVDLIPGPSEIMVIADNTANASWVAADLLAQAEHGRGSVICLVALETELLEAVQNEIARQVKSLSLMPARFLSAAFHQLPPVIFSQARATNFQRAVQQNRLAD